MDTGNKMLGITTGKDIYSCMAQPLNFEGANYFTSVRIACVAVVSFLRAWEAHESVKAKRTKESVRGEGAMQASVRMLQFRSLTQTLLRTSINKHFN